MKPFSLKKSALSTQYIADYLLQLNESDRLAPIAQLAKEFDVSVGLLQQSIKEIESAGAIVLNRRGRLGTTVERISHEILFNFSSMKNIFCVMPLPYTKRYEGLASGLKKSLAPLINVNFAFMNGSKMRADCLSKGHYNYAIVSELAADALLNEYDDLVIALELGEQSYVAIHQLLSATENPKKLAFDKRSIDQQALTLDFCQGDEFELVDATYNEIIDVILQGKADAGILNLEGITLPSSLKKIDLPNSENIKKAKRAVLLCRKEDFAARALARLHICINDINTIQKSVIDGYLTPSY